MNYVEEILNKELIELHRCKEKSIISYKENKIDKLTHKTHLKNLTPKIKELTRYINLLKLENRLKTRNDLINLLNEYSLFLEKEGYLDIDYKTEEPFAVDKFIKQYKL